MEGSFFESGEKAIFELRRIYQRYGYSHYKMSKFEEYDLYVRNKDFLVSDNVITFTDTDGRLMALKPDVTLSIVNNTVPAKKAVQKVYYNENVYRVSKGTQSYKEIMQVGLECLGDVDDYCIGEVMNLAAESLNTISEDFVLDISHLGLVASVLDSLELSVSARQKVVRFLGEKNSHGIAAVMAEEGKSAEVLLKLVATYGGSEKVYPFLEEIRNQSNSCIIDNFMKIFTALEENGFKNKVRIDFSLISDMNYYNGFVFKGFIRGISAGVLSGGQYDLLMEKMGKNCGAIGFAVYLDLLERFENNQKECDADAVVLYDEKTDMAALLRTVKMLSENDKTVLAARKVPEKLRYRQLLKMNEKGVEVIENA